SGLVIEVRGLRSDLKVTNPLVTVDITAQAPQSIMATLRQGDIHPYIDLGDVSAGVRTVPIHVEVRNVPPGAANVFVSPDSVQVQLEEQVGRNLPVTAQVVGQPAFGYKVETAQLDPAQVRVTGSKDDVGRAAKVIVRVEIEGSAGTRQGSRAPIALDADGKEIKGLTFDPQAVQITVPIT